MSWLRINGRPKAICVEILGNVQFIRETLPKFRQKVSVFSKWARHRGDVGNFKGFVPSFGNIRGGSFRFDALLS
ncbi:Leucine-rich repeat family protein, partial [Prunus dulcis]